MLTKLSLDVEAIEARSVNSNGHEGTKGACIVTFKSSEGPYKGELWSVYPRMVSNQYQSDFVHT